MSLMRAAVSDEVNDTKTGHFPATNDLFPRDNVQDKPHLATIAKRFSAMARSSYKEMSAFAPLVGAKQTSTH